MQLSAMLKSLIAFLGVLLAPSVARAAITITIVAPASGSLSGDSLPVQVSVSSTYQLQTVHAQVETVGADLTYSGAWNGSLSLASLASGSKSLTVVATDVFSTTGSAQINFTLDRKPNVVLAAPLPDTVARPFVSVSASCTDDNPSGCSALQVRTVDCSGPILASGTSSISQSVSLSAFEGMSVGLVVCGVDSANQTVSKSASVHVESSPTLIEVDSVGGKILDFDSGRILWLEQDGLLRITDGATKQVTTVPTISTSPPKYGYLSPSGAIWVAGSTGYTQVIDWDGVQAVDLVSCPKSSDHLSA